MSAAFESFVDRRNFCQPASVELQERRQFANSYVRLSPEAQQLAHAIDGYKLRHRRRYIDYDEMLAVIKDLGYRQMNQAAPCPHDQKSSPVEKPGFQG